MVIEISMEKSSLSFLDMLIFASHYFRLDAHKILERKGKKNQIILFYIDMKLISHQRMRESFKTMKLIARKIFQDLEANPKEIKKWVK